MATINGFIPIPAPVGPNVGNEIAQAAALYPMEAEQARQNKIAEAESKLKLQQGQQALELQTQQTALNKLRLYYQMAKTHPQRALDQTFMQMVNTAAKEAELGDLSIPGGQALDIDALGAAVGGYKLPGQFDQGQEQSILQAQPGAQREAAFELAGGQSGAMPKEIAEAPAYMTAAERELMTKEVDQQVLGLANGKNTVSGLLSFLSYNKNRLQSAGITTSELLDKLNDPASPLRTDISREAAAKITEYESLGIKNIDQSKYLEMKTTELPKEIAAKIQNWRAGQTIAQEKVDAEETGLRLKAATLANDTRKTDAYVAGINSLIQTRAATVGNQRQNNMTRQIQAQATILKNVLAPMMQEREDLNRRMGSYISAGKDIPKDVLDQWKALNTQIDAAQASISAAGSLPNPTAATVGRSSDKNVLPVESQGQPQSRIKGTVYKDKNGNMARYMGGDANDPRNWEPVK